ncbi:hypothetical protein HNQ35_002345, partial [Cerasibacillus quisquiliarum]|nr:hypothetical protein [Cerasibacillus quisquiliarum]
NDIAFVINDLVESIPEEAFQNFLRKRASFLSLAHDVEHHFMCIFPTCVFW